MWDNTKKAILKFQRDVIARARKNLKKKNASGNLSKSLEPSKIVEKDGVFEFGIDGAYYGDFIDKGVSGVLKKYNTPYSYRDKMPPPRKLDKWLVRRRIAGRDDQGRFISRKSLQYIIARSIYLNGIKPSKFMTKAVEVSEKRMIPVILEAMQKDIANGIN